MSYLFAYSMSGYWAFQTLTTVGYGDFGAYNDQEVWITLFWMFLGVIFYTFVVGSMTTLATTGNKAAEQLDQKLSALDDFKEEVGLDGEIYKNIKNFMVNNY